MHDSKLLTLIRGLRREEFHWFQKFLDSPFYNTNTEIIDLFKYLKKYYPDFESPKLRKVIAFKKLYPKEKFDIQKMRKVMHGLAVLVEEFMVAIHIRKQSYQRKKILVKEMGERNLYRSFEKETKELIRGLDILPYRDVNTYKELHQLSFEYYDHIETSRQNTNIDFLKNASLHLDYFYLSQKQQLLFATKTHERLFKAKLKLSTLTQAKSDLQEDPVFKLYQLIISITSKPYDDGTYKNIESLFKNSIQKIGRKDKLIIIKILLNYISHQINKGKKGFQAKILSLYKFGLAQNFLVENDQISEGSFINISSIAVYEKEYEWAENFINTYEKYLPKSKKSDAKNLSLGFLFYHKKEYTQTINLILNHPFTKPLLILQSKIILLRTYFEQYLIDESYYELLIAQTQSFEKFIRRNDQISNTKKERVINFVLFIRKIANAHWQNNLDISLYKKIQNTESIVLKFWLLEQVKREIKK